MTGSAIFENCNCKTALLSPYYKNRNFMKFLCADSKFQNIQAMIVEKIKRESERGQLESQASEFAVVFSELIDRRE